MAKIKPTKLQIGQPVLGSTSKKWMIAGGVGLEDKKGNYIGTMTIGFELNILLSKLQDLVKHYPNINFVLLDKNLRIVSKEKVIEYKNYDFGIKDKKFDENLTKLAQSSHQQQITNISLLNPYANYKISKIRNSPYLIFLKYNDAKFAGSLWLNYVYRIGELVLVLLISALILVIIYKKEKRLRYKLMITNEIEKQNLSKTTFLSAIAHDIRGPAAGIKQLAEMLQDKVEHDISKEEEIELIKHIEVAGAELIEFASDLLDVGQAGSGNFQLKEVKKHQVRELIERSVKLVRGRALKDSIQIKTQIADKLPMLECDARRMKQIIVNLLTNSIKYSKAGTKITVIAKKAHEDGKKLVIIVKDQGFGMSEENIKKALEKYQTIENENSGKVDSLGLGLPLVKHLIELHNGILEIKSEIGKGSEFIMIY